MTTVLSNWIKDLGIWASAYLTGFVAVFPELSQVEFWDLIIKFVLGSPAAAYVCFKIYNDFFKSKNNGEKAGEK